MDEQNENILLSICIPTFNRCDSLDRTLKSIIEQNSFDHRVEVVISDNCSTDNTRNTVSKYQTLHKNIIYHCNENNILDENFTKVLSLGKGEYLKLINDTLLFKEGTLDSFYIDLAKYREKKPVLLFFKNNERYADSIITCTDLNQFVDTTSYYIGWIANFGAWKVHFDKIENKNRCSFLQFVQIDWSLRMAENNNSVIVFSDWFDAQPVNKKGSYNIFEVHIDNYLFLYQSYLNNGTLSYCVFHREKKRLLKYSISDWIHLLLFRKDGTYCYKTDGWKRIFWRQYKSYPLIYIRFFKESLKFLYDYLIIRNLKDEISD